MNNGRFLTNIDFLIKLVLNIVRISSDINTEMRFMGLILIYDLNRLSGIALTFRIKSVIVHIMANMFLAIVESVALFITFLIYFAETIVKLHTL
jgi:hypothetical protein